MAILRWGGLILGLESSFILTEVRDMYIMAPSFMRRKDNETELNQDIVAKLIAQLEEEPAKPWTVVSRVSDQLDQDPEEVRETVRQLALQGKITPTADGDLRKALVEA